MNESMEIDNADIQGTVRDFLDEVLDCVEAQTNWIEQLLLKLRRGLAQQVADVLIREASCAIDTQDSGDGYVDRLGARIHSQQALQTDQRQIIEGQLIRQPDLQNVFNSQHMTPHRRRSLTLLSTCFKSNMLKPADIKPSPSSRSLSVRIITKEQHGSDRMSNSLCSQSEDLSRATVDIGASNLTEDILEYPKSAKMKTVTTSRGEIQVPAYCFDDMEEIELDGHASKEILTDTDTKKDSKKKIGFFSRMGKFFRRLCCCFAQEEESD